MVALFYTAANSTSNWNKGSNFSVSLTRHAVFCSFDSGHPNGSEVISQCDFDLHLPYD